LKYNDSLQEIFKIQNKIEDIHPFLKKVFPIAIVEDDHFLVFDTDSSEKKYVFIKEVPTPMPIPKGIRAAFPLEFYKNKASCVVSGEIFDSLEGYVTIFHEFMHCQQWKICELKLKSQLGVAQKEITKKNYMWEINYPFPYDDAKFVENYSLFLESLKENDHNSVLNYRSQLKMILNEDDFEYQVWEEWKEGFARFIENQIRLRLGLEENHNGTEKPFSRVVFYEGGARFIKFLTEREPELLVDIERLFHKMLNVKL